MSPGVRRRVALLLAMLSIPAVAPAADDGLVGAARRHDRAEVRRLLAQRADVDAAQGDGATALHWAVYWNDEDLTELLVRAGARVDVANAFGATPLWLACANGSAALVTRLLGAGANPNRGVASGETVLMRCAYTGNPQAVAALIRRGSDVNAKEPSRGQTALMWAVGQRHPAVVRLLLQHGADVRARTNARRQWVGNGKAGPAGPSGDPEMMEVQEGGFTPLLFAAQQGDVECARLLLAAGADVNATAADGSSVLVVASHSGHGKLAAFLLESGADPNANGAGYTALHAAILRGNPSVVKALLVHRADPSAPVLKPTAVRRFTHQWVIPGGFVGATPFWLAARYAESDIMQLLAEAGADTRTPLKDGTTPLMAAAGVGWSSSNSDRRTRALSLDILLAEAEDEERTLRATTTALAAGGDVTASNASGDTALHGAAAHGYTRVVELLVARGGNLHAANRAGRTPAELLQRSQKAAR